MSDIVLTDADLATLKGLLKAQGRASIDDITVDDANLLKATFELAAESARIGTSNYANLTIWRAWLYAANPENKLIPVLTDVLGRLHDAWPELLPAPDPLPEVKS